MRIFEQLANTRRELGGKALEAFFRGSSSISKRTPWAKAALRDIEIHSDIGYRPDSSDAAHTLDIYRPKNAAGKLPIVFHVHGGGFRILSKDTHWIMALRFAQQGYLVVNINYRLAPKHPFPAGLDDTCEAYLWTLQNIESYGGDLRRLVVAGESAGANLITGLTIMNAQRRSRKLEQRVFDANVRPIAAIPFCGFLQASDVERFFPSVSPLVRDRMEVIRQGYLGDSRAEDTSLADPLCVLESDVEFERELPPFFAPVGGADPILSDSLRLERAIRERGGRCDAPIYDGGIHAFHAFVFWEGVRRAWDDTFRFLRDTVPDA